MTTPSDASTARATPLIGRLIGGKFRIESLLGAGGMGNVYRAEQLSLSKPVAVKILHHDLMTDETVVKRFEREARSASRLDHPNLVRIIDFGRDTDTGVLFIAMELLSGRDLGQVIAQDGPMPLHRIVRIMSQMLAALEEAHAQGVVHRDLKPANIMLVDRRGELDLVKVCDFGIAKSNSLPSTQNNSMLTVRGFVCGTPEYMAPEQARGEAVDGRTDLYAAAVILYQLITGQVPFTASSPVGVLSQHLDRAAPAPRAKRPDIPRALDLLILRGLEKEPINRPQTAAAFRQELESVCSISAHGRSEGTTQTIYATAAAPRRGGHLKRGGFALGVLLGAGVAAFSYLQKPPAPPVAAVPGPARSVVLPEPRVDELPPRAATPVPTVAVDDAPPERPAPAAVAVPAKHHRPVKAVALRAAVPAEMETVASPRPAPTTATAAATASVGEAALPSSGPRGAKELLADAEKLLSQGEVSSACARGEEARALAPKMPAISRFLGKCYMRAGNVPKASERYKSYLELAPDAPDAAFIKSIVK
jgi:tRNA A-37 threonylcarbamoyl transferase component Bud32